MLRHGGGSGGHVIQLQWIPQRGVAPISWGVAVLNVPLLSTWHGHTANTCTVNKMSSDG